MLLECPAVDMFRIFVVDPDRRPIDALGSNGVVSFVVWPL